MKKSRTSKTTKLPSKAYFPHFLGPEYDEISYFPRQDSLEDNLKEIKLPKWLQEMIKGEVTHAFEKGKIEKEREIKSALGLET